MHSSIFGHIPNVPPGQKWLKRQEVSLAGVHRPHQTGISGTKAAGGACSVVVNNGYHDSDCGDIIWYMGSGGFRRPGTKQVSSTMQHNQNPHDPYNGALQTSLRTRRPVRVVRGWKATGSPWAPLTGYRYDGLYVVTRADIVSDPTRNTSFTCVIFRMERLAESGYEIPIARGQASLAWAKVNQGRTRKLKEDNLNASLNSNKHAKQCKTAPRPQQLITLQTHPTQTPPSPKSFPPHESLSNGLQPIKQRLISQNQTPESHQPAECKGVFSMKFKRHQPTVKPIYSPEAESPPVPQGHNAKKSVLNDRPQSQRHHSVASMGMLLGSLGPHHSRLERRLSPLTLNDFTLKAPDWQSQHGRPAPPNSRHSSTTLYQPRSLPPRPNGPLPSCTTVEYLPVQSLPKDIKPAPQFTSTFCASPETLESLLLEIEAFTEIELNTCLGSMELEEDQSLAIKLDPAGLPSAQRELTIKQEDTSDEPHNTIMPQISGFGLKKEAGTSDNLLHNDTMTAISGWPQVTGNTEQVKWETSEVSELDGTELQFEEESIDSHEQGPDGSDQLSAIPGPHELENMAWGGLDGIPIMDTKQTAFWGFDYTPANNTLSPAKTSTATHSAVNSATSVPRSWTATLSTLPTSAPIRKTFHGAWGSLSHRLHRSSIFRHFPAARCCLVKHIIAPSHINIIPTSSCR